MIGHVLNTCRWHLFFKIHDLIIILIQGQMIFKKIILFV